MWLLGCCRPKRKNPKNSAKGAKRSNAHVYAISHSRDNSQLASAMGVSSTECVMRHPSSSCKLPTAHHHHQHSCRCLPGPVIAQNGPHHHHHHHQLPPQQQQPQQQLQQQQQQQQHQQRHHHQSHQQSGMVQHQHHHHHHHQSAKHTQPQQQQHHEQTVVLPTPQSAASDTKILAPFKSKMKVLKKLMKMGLAPRSSNTGTNNLPPLTFHQVHGDNIRLSNGNTIARRYESFCKGVTFSARPVRVGERVCIKFVEVANTWSGVIRFGFTSNDPINLRNELPRYACPDLTNKPGYWAKALAEHLVERDSVLFYYVTSAGDVHFGVNGEEKGVFFSGVETRSPLWTIIDIYGNSTGIEFVDPNRQRFNNVRRSLEHRNEDNAQLSRHAAMDDASNASRDVERLIVPSMQTVRLHHDVELPGLKFQPPGVLFTPLSFHPTCGRNIRFSNQQLVATRTDTEFCQGYAFTNRPLVLGERLVVQILATEPMYVGALALGLTSCDPSHLTAEDLPDDSDLLLDRPEYWVVSKDVASSPQPGDEIAFTVTHFGEVQMSKNGGPPNVVMHVDQSLQLWAFVDVYGSTQRVRMLASRAPSSPPRQRASTAAAVAAAAAAAAAAPVPASSQPPSNHSNGATELSRFSELVQFKPAVGGGTVLVVNLPPQNSYPQPPPPTPQPIYAQSSHRASAAPSSSARQSSPPLTGTMASTSSSTYVDPVNYQSIESTPQPTPSTSSMQQWSEGRHPTPGQPSECSICYERSIDSVLYMCGHMCMCYTCALQQWRGKGGGHCPLCRATIRDVIRIYKS